MPRSVHRSTDAPRSVTGGVGGVGGGMAWSDVLLKYC